MEELDEQAAGAYARRVGERLRAIRRQKSLSLQEVEASSNQEFKASVLGAYERGERSISVPRLQRLARFYNVPVDQLLPRDVEVDLTEAGQASVVEAGAGRPVTANGKQARDKVTIDLTAFSRVHEPEAQMLHRYVRMIQIQRQDFNGRVLTLRADDLKAIACFFGTDGSGLLRRLDDLHLRVTA